MFLTKKVSTFLKRNTCRFFFGKIHRSKHKCFLKKMCVHQKGECCESFSEYLKGLRCVHELIKEHLLETMSLI